MTGLVRFAPAAWREVDGTNRRFGLTVTAHVATLWVGRRCYRLRWTLP